MQQDKQQQETSEQNAARDWILASGSLSRRAMLDQVGLDYRAVPADIDESALHSQYGAISGAHISFGLAKAKAFKVSSQFPDSLVIGSDQVLECRGRLIHKAASVAEATETFTLLQGNWHSLTASVAVLRGCELLFCATDIAHIRIAAMTKQAITEYLQRYWQVVQGTVGAYRMEAEGIALVEEIRGAHATVLGMPLLPLLRYIRSLPG